MPELLGNLNSVVNVQSMLASSGLKHALDRVAGGLRWAARRIAPHVHRALFERPGRLRLWSYAAFAAILGGAALAGSLGLGGIALFGADPFRTLSRPLQALQGARGSADADPRAALRNLYEAESALLALLSRASAAQARPEATAPLRSGVRSLRSLAATGPTPIEQVNAISRAAATEFGEALAGDLIALIETDAERAQALAEAGWDEDLSPRVRALRQARQPLQRLRGELASAQDAAGAISAAQRIAEIGMAMAGVRAPVQDAEQVLALRRDFTELDARIGGLVSELRAQAEDRPWLLASSERKQAWRLASARWQAIAPLAGRLSGARALVFATRDPDAARAAIHEARQVETEVTAALAQTQAPPHSEPAPVAAPRVDYRDRAIAAAREAREIYRAAYEAYAPVITAPYTRRRDRRRAAEMRDELAALHGLSRQVLGIEQRVLETDSEREAERLARQLPRLAEDMRDSRRRLDRLSGGLE